MSDFLEHYHTLARSQLGIPEDHVVFGTASSIEVEWGTPGDPEESETFAVDLPAEYSLVRCAPIGPDGKALRDQAVNGFVRKPFDHHSVAEDLFYSEVRIGEIIWLAGQSSVASDRLEEFIRELDDEEMKEVFPGIPDYVLEELSGRDGWEHLLEWCFKQRVLGFLVRIETPVRTYHSQEATGYSFSWGHYRITWLLCDRIEDAVQAGLRWAEEMGQKDKAKAAKKGGSR